MHKILSNITITYILVYIYIHVHVYQSVYMYMYTQLLCEDESILGKMYTYVFVVVQCACVIWRESRQDVFHVVPLRHARCCVL